MSKAIAVQYKQAFFAHKYLYSCGIRLIHFVMSSFTLLNGHIHDLSVVHVLHSLTDNSLFNVLSMVILRQGKGCSNSSTHSAHLCVIYVMSIVLVLSCPLYRQSMLFQRYIIHSVHHPVTYQLHFINYSCELLFKQGQRMILIGQGLRVARGFMLCNCQLN